MPTDVQPRSSSVLTKIQARWERGVRLRTRDGQNLVVECTPETLAEFCQWLFCDLSMSYAMLVVQDTPEHWDIRHIFHDDSWVLQARVELPLHVTTLPSIAIGVHAADWHEREAEDLFGLTFEGHPRLGDFVLHEHWPEGTNPMRASFDASQALPPRKQATPWQPVRLLESEGSFTMPIGPIYSDVSESALFMLETVGEDVLRTIPRLFFKYRGVEKLAQGQSANDVILLAERFTGTSAFAHSLAFCQAIEAIADIQIPPRALVLRMFAAELERIRHHVSVLAKLCSSTALAVAASKAAILEEQMLRSCCEFSEHRYLFGLNAIGGLSKDVTDETCHHVLDETQQVCMDLAHLRHKLTRTSSFLDRLEDVGVISKDEALAHSMVGPAARASGISRDLRHELPYGPYLDASALEVPYEDEGDGYARMRIFFDEIDCSLELMKEALRDIPAGGVRAEEIHIPEGQALAWVEAPGGGAFHMLRTDEQGRVIRWRLSPPSFANWHGFHLAAENFAFQDFPIILASMGLSVAESDR